jgi:hypothetical protein
MGQVSEEYQDKDAATQRSAAPAITLLTAEALRGAAFGARPCEPTPGKGEERISLFWRVFGGTLLSIAALVVVTLYQQFTGSINELRGDIERLNEARGDLIKKDEFNSRLTSLWGGLNDAKGIEANVAAVREKQTHQDQHVQQIEDERKDLLRQVQQLRERVAKLEGSQGGVKPAAARDIPD